MDQSQVGTAYSTQAGLRSVQLSSGMANKYVDGIHRDLDLWQLKNLQDPMPSLCVFHTLIYLVYTEESGFIDIATRIHGKTNQLRLRCYMLFIGT